MSGPVLLAVDLVAVSADRCLRLAASNCAVTRGTVFCSKAASRVIAVDCLKDDVVRVPASGCHAPCWQGPGGGGSADTGGVVATPTAPTLLGPAPSTPQSGPTVSVF